MPFHCLAEEKGRIRCNLGGQRPVASVCQIKRWNPWADRTIITFTFRLQRIVNEKDFAWWSWQFAKCQPNDPGAQFRNRRSFCNLIFFFSSFLYFVPTILGYPSLASIGWCFYRVWPEISKWTYSLSNSLESTGHSRALQSHRDRHGKASSLRLVYPLMGSTSWRWNFSNDFLKNNPGKRMRRSRIFCFHEAENLLERS